MHCLMNNLCFEASFDVYGLMVPMSNASGLICPNIQKLIEKGKEEASKCYPEWNGKNEYQVTGPGGQFVVNLDTRTCACRKWDLTGIPCKHAIFALEHQQSSPESYVSPWYHRSKGQLTYSFSVHGLNSSELWEKTGKTIQAPPYLIKPGKNRSKRIPGNDEKQKGTKLSKKIFQQYVTCRKCGQVGHNKRGCKSTITLPPKVKKAIGRPKKNTNPSVASTNTNPNPSQSNPNPSASSTSPNLNLSPSNPNPFVATNPTPPPSNPNPSLSTTTTDPPTKRKKSTAPPRAPRPPKSVKNSKTSNPQPSQTSQSSAAPQSSAPPQPSAPPSQSSQSSNPAPSVRIRNRQVEGASFKYKGKPTITMAQLQSAFKKPWK